MADLTCLAEGLVVPADFEQTGLNLNEIVVGPTGCGKSFSNAYSRLVHTTESSVVVPVAKRAIKLRFAEMFRQRGYKVIDLDFTHPEKCDIGYDPLDFAHNAADYIQLARNCVGTGLSKGMTGETDPYWNDGATSVIAAYINLEVLRAKDERRRPVFANVIKLHRSMNVIDYKGLFRSTLDGEFEEAEKRHPGNMATNLWKTIYGLSSKTASCIISIVNNAFDKTFSENVIEMTKKNQRVSFKELGNRKVALFITTSPMNTTLQNYVNVMYSDMFRELFETAEKSEDNRLNIPVHIICDDFACGSRIRNFEDYISIFRAAGISVTLLLQSETQLISMYGEHAATTIINNCDTYVYMGGMDNATCRSISVRINRPVHQVMQLPLEKVIVFRRGHKPYEARRYQLLQDAEYQKVMDLSSLANATRE